MIHLGKLLSEKLKSGFLVFINFHKEILKIIFGINQDGITVGKIDFYVCG
jgi:hypothetical protein